MLLKVKKLNWKLFYVILFLFTCLPSILSKEFFGLTINTERIVIPLLGVVLSFLVILNKNTFKTFFMDKYNLFFLFWLIYSFVSILWAQDKKEWFKGIFFLGIGIIFLLIIEYTAVHYNLLESYIKILVFCMLFHNIVGWIEIIGKKYLFLFEEETKLIYSIYHLPVSVFGNTNDYATFLCLGIFFYG